MDMKLIEKEYEMVIVGGGISGVCSAIASARNGCKTAIIQNRPVLGGNASSEIRMHICGADCHASRPNARETGILEEILLENKARNPNHSFSIFDTILWEKVHFQNNLDLYLNSHMTKALVRDNKILNVTVNQLTTEKVFEISGQIFVDATGDGTLGFIAGAQYTVGREGREVYDEKHAPKIGDSNIMGNTIMFSAKDLGYEVPYQKPDWAYTFTEDDLKYRSHEEITSGYWWVELGGDDLDIISDGEEIRDELLKSVYGVWDHIKNKGEHGAKNYSLDWIGFLPGKRESRRLIGDYVLRESDLLEARRFCDAVAYGGWPMDMHVVGGIKSNSKPTQFLDLDDVYTIPYRSLYSKNIDNLYIGGRAISASHMAFGSTRVMATCAVIGQAIGTAGAMACKRGITPRNLVEFMDELQQKLLRDDCYIPGVSNNDLEDLAKKSKVNSSSQEEGFECGNIINGITRKVDNDENSWMSKVIGEDGEWISLDFDERIVVSELEIKFDSNLSRQIMPTLSDSHKKSQVELVPCEIVKDYKVQAFKSGRSVFEESIKGNYQRFRRHKLSGIVCDNIKIIIQSTNGCEKAKIFEVRVY